MTLDDILMRHAGREANLLPVLHDVQAAFGHISDDAIRAIAAALNLTRAEVHGVVSFYHDFKTAPDRQAAVKLCRAEACQARGVDALLARMTDVQAAQIETVYCLGLCAVGPAALVGTQVHARLDAAKLAALIA